MIVEFILEHEGGLVDHPSDPGGLTNYGICQRSYPDVDIRNLTRDAAKAIYYNDYWLACRCDALPISASALVFDAAVNQGPGFARKTLQRAARAVPDGVIGPGTLRAVHLMRPVVLVREIALRRALRYVSLSTFSTFGKGWLRRLFACTLLAGKLLD